MKTTIQTYGLIFAFSIMFLVIIQLLSFSAYYSKLTSIASYVTEVIEVNEGINDTVLTEIANFDNEFIEIIYQQEIINERYCVYKITAKANIHLLVVGTNYQLTSTKYTRRVIY